MFDASQHSLNLGGGKSISKEIILKDVIVDRGSRYTVVGIPIENLQDIKPAIKKLNTDSYFRKSTHNTYAYRITSDSSVIEGKNDDGEVGAGMCILRELRRGEVLNSLVIVTRYFGGTQLHADRFKNVIDATKILLEKI